MNVYNGKRWYFYFTACKASLNLSCIIVSVTMSCYFTRHVEQSQRGMKSSRQGRSASVRQRVLILQSALLLCWLPQILLLLLLLAGHSIPAHVSGWLAITIVPLAAITNPTLYTLVWVPRTLHKAKGKKAIV